MLKDLKFDKLAIEEVLLQNIVDCGYSSMTPIQAKAIPTALEGRDILGKAQTGTGKTAAFCLPIIQYLLLHPIKHRGGRPRALVLAPTRELATQILEKFQIYSKGFKFKTALITGGSNSKTQVRSLEKGVDFCVATPGRLGELLYHGQIVLDQVELLVLDEVDKMLEMGFYEEVVEVLNLLPVNRQSMMFSATLPDDIRILAKEILDKPIVIEISEEPVNWDKIKQFLYRVDQKNKSHLLYYLNKKFKMGKTIVFVKTKIQADRVAKVLGQYPLNALPLHGDKSQSVRNKTLEKFKKGECQFLVATDLASRGIDVQDISYVINFDMPIIAEDYIHRIGRTGRAGKEGVAISFCDQQESSYINPIEKLLGNKIKRATKHPFSEIGAEHGYSVPEAKKLLNPETIKAKKKSKKSNNNNSKFTKKRKK